MSTNVIFLFSNTSLSIGFVSCDLSQTKFVRKVFCTCVCVYFHYMCHTPIMGREKFTAYMKNRDNKWGKRENSTKLYFVDDL